MSIPILDVLLNVAYLFSAVSYYVRDILVLRALAVGASAVGLSYFFLRDGDPAIAPIAWLSLFVLINASRIVGLWLERRRVSMTEEERELHEVVFKNFSPVEFMKLLRIGEWRRAAPETVIAEQGEVLEDVKLISNGEVAILKDGVEIDRSRDGALIGEMSFISGGPATATVRCLRPTRYLAWKKEELRGLLQRNPTMDVAMTTVFSRDLTQKLAER